MQSCHNDVRAMTTCFYVSNERASLGLSRAFCTKSVAYVGRAKKGLNSDLGGTVVTMPTKLEINWDRGKKLERARKHCVPKTNGIWFMFVIAIKIVLGAKSVNPICPIDNACNAWAENVQDLYYDPS